MSEHRVALPIPITRDIAGATLDVTCAVDAPGQRRLTTTWRGTTLHVNLNAAAVDALLLVLGRPHPLTPVEEIDDDIHRGGLR